MEYDWSMQNNQKGRIPRGMWILLILVIAISFGYSIPRTIRTYRGSELQQMVNDYRSSRSRLGSGQQFLYQGAVYFLAPEQNGTLVLAEVPAEVSHSEGLNELIRRLLKGPSLEDLAQQRISLIPEGTTLIGTSVVKNAAYIELSKEIQQTSYFGREGTEYACRQITETAKSLPYIDDCIIVVDGSAFFYSTSGY